MHLEDVIKEVWRCTWWCSICRWNIGRKASTEAETLFIGQTQALGNVEG